MNRTLFLLTFWLSGALMAPGALKVVALHPFIGDLARNVGGDAVEVKDLLPLGGNPHDYEPSPSDFRNVADADIVLASGKKLENYLNKIRDNMSPRAKLIEVGREVPSCLIEANNEIFVCCPAHSVGSIDPHWWHSIKGMRRAAKVLAREFAKEDAANASLYSRQAKAYDRELDNLYRWAKKEVGAIPRSRRVLCTAHAAFGYFCRDFGFRAAPVQGLTKERNPSPSYLAETIGMIRKLKIPAVFPENTANPKILSSMVQETGVTLGGTLLADAPSDEHPTYIGTFRHNVSTIVAAFKP
ncbi:MAG: metal ABC transporter substrate-binding protein [Verrucomicrobiota bacterium]